MIAPQDREEFLRKALAITFTETTQVTTIVKVGALRKTWWGWCWSDGGAKCRIVDGFRWAPRD